MQQQIALDVEESKKKDDFRCIKTIDDYEKVCTPAKKNAFVVQTWQETEMMQK